MADVYYVLGRRVRAERLSRHLTQRELADVAGMNTTHLNRIEHGKAVPSVKALKDIADALGVPIGRLFMDVPARKLADRGWAGKIATMVRDLPPREQARVLNVVKALSQR